MRSLALAIVALALAGAAPPPGRIVGHLTIRKGAKVRTSCEGAVVYLSSPDLPARPSGRAVISQKHRKFIPPLSVVVKGTRVDFPNLDNFNHTVKSESRAAADLFLAEYDSSASRSYTFKVAGEVDLGCAIHPEMAAKVKVVPNAWYARVANDCSFAIEGVPPGRQEITSWLANSTESHTTVVVEPGKSARIAVELKEGERPSARRSWYPR